jgi:leader peptidase (prepilin peptidase) / N-methyltransferase
LARGGTVASMTNAALLATAAVGAGAGPFLATVAARRSAEQPVSVDPDAERELLDAVEGDPTLMRWAAGLDADAFSHPAHGERWAVLCADPGPTEDAVAPGAAELGDTYADAVATALGAGIPAGAPTDVAALAQRIRDAAADRNLDGARGLHPTGDPDRPLERHVVAPSGARKAACAGLGALGGAAAVWLAPTPLGALTLAVLCAGLVVVSLVDLDTLYIDGPWFWSLTALTWSLAGLDAVTAGHPGRLLSGLGLTAVLAVGVAVVAWVYSKLRKRGGLGGGDLQLLLVVVAVPATVSGSWSVPLVGLMVAMGLSIAVRLTLIAGRRASVNDAFAFGPYLSLGWALAWAALAIGSAS